MVNLTMLNIKFNEDLFKIGSWGISLLDLIITAVCLILLVVTLVVIISKIKKENRERVESQGALDANAKTSKQLKKEERANKKILDKSSATLPVSSADALTNLLGFDPYSQIETQACEIAETYYDKEQDTEDMRSLRLKMNQASQCEKKVTLLRERLNKIRYEIGKVSRFIRDNRVVIASAVAVSDKLHTELTALTVDKKAQKANRASIERVSAQLQASNRTANELTREVDLRSEEDRKLKDAQAFVTAEIARTEQELSFVNKEIDTLNETVGVELKRIESENRARELMTKYRELKPLLIAVNVSLREINKLDASLADIHEEKHSLREKISAGMEELKVSYGALEAEQCSQKLSKLNERMIELDQNEEKLIRRKEERIEEFKINKRKANEFLDAEKYEFNDIVSAEDKVVGELEYEQLRLDYETRKYNAFVAQRTAQEKYDETLAKKVKNSKRNAEAYKRHEEELKVTLDELKKARAEYEKASADCDKVLPTISPSSLVRSGTGVISKERLAKRNDEMTKQTPERKRENKVDELAPTRYPRASSVQSRTRNTFAPLSTQSNSNKLRQLMARLNELERMAIQEKENRALMRMETGASNQSKIERRRAQIVALRKNLNYIDSESSAREFKRKLYAISLSLDEEEASDNVLSEMIRRTMNEATRLGERATHGNGYDGSNGRK